jgi:hypothetical protein
VRPNDLELVRLRRTDRRTGVAIVVAALFLVAAVFKPWSGLTGAGSAASASPIELVAGASGVASGTGALSSARAGSGAALCQSPDGWRIVADDTELGRAVRTWIVADVELSAAPPARSTIPVTVVASSGVLRLGFCRPAVAGSSDEIWSGTLWRQGPDPADPVRWQVAARLAPARGSIGALVSPPPDSPPAWPPGSYVLEADFAGAATETWLGLVIPQG